MGESGQKHCDADATAMEALNIKQIEAFMVPEKLKQRVQRR